MMAEPVWPVPPRMAYVGMAVELGVMKGQSHDMANGLCFICSGISGRRPMAEAEWGRWGKYPQVRMRSLEIQWD